MSRVAMSEASSDLRLPGREPGFPAPSKVTDWEWFVRDRPRSLLLHGDLTHAAGMVVLDSLHDLVVGVHDEWPVP